MNVVFMEKKKSKVPVLDEEGKQVKEKGELVFREKVEDEEVEFEVHPHELLSSVATRYIEYRKMPLPPPNIKPVLVNAVNGAWQPPNITVKDCRALVFQLIGAPVRS